MYIHKAIPGDMNFHVRIRTLSVEQLDHLIVKKTRIQIQGIPPIKSHSLRLPAVSFVYMQTKILMPSHKGYRVQAQGLYA